MFKKFVRYTRSNYTNSMKTKRVKGIHLGKWLKYPSKERGERLLCVCHWRTLNLKLKVRIPGEKKSPAGESWDFSSFWSRQRRDWRNCRETAQRGIKGAHWKYILTEVLAYCVFHSQNKRKFISKKLSYNCIIDIHVNNLPFCHLPLCIDLTFTFSSVLSIFRDFGWLKHCFVFLV